MDDESPDSETPEPQKQRTRQGYVLPVPDCDDFLPDLRKIARPELLERSGGGAAGSADE